VQQLPTHINIDAGSTRPCHIYKYDKIEGDVGVDGTWAAHCPRAHPRRPAPAAAGNDVALTTAREGERESVRVKRGSRGDDVALTTGCRRLRL